MNLMLWKTSQKISPSIILKSLCKEKLTSENTRSGLISSDINMKIWDAMLSRIKSYSNLYPILGLLIFLYICIISNNVLLADDLSKLYEGSHNKDNYGSFLGSFMSGTNMTSRPISAFFTGSIIYLLKYNPLYYYLAFIFFLLLLALCLVF